MRVRVIGRLLTPLVAKSRIFPFKIPSFPLDASTSHVGLPGATPGPVVVEDLWDTMSPSFHGESQERGHTHGSEDANQPRSRIFARLGTIAISSRPYADWGAPYRHGCRRILLVKQGGNRYPFWQRACLGYVHVDFKAKTHTQAMKEITCILQISCLGKLTGWGYGRISWLQAHLYPGTSSIYIRKPRFRILKGLPQGFTKAEQTLIAAALLHDLVDNSCHPSKLGRSLTIHDPKIRWLCENHHAAQHPSTPPALRLLQEADCRTSAYARFHKSPTRKRKLAPVDLAPVTTQLQSALETSVYKLYTVIYSNTALRVVTASKEYPSESLRNHLLGTANWVMYFLRTRQLEIGASAPRAGLPGGTPGPVAVEDPRDTMSPSFRGESRAT